MNTLTAPSTGTSTPTAPAAESPFDVPESARYGHTPETWAVLCACPAQREAFAISEQLAKLSKRVAVWVATHGQDTDPGATAIVAAGLELPNLVAEEGGTNLAELRNEFVGVGWCLQMLAGLVASLVIHPPRQS